MLEEVLDPTRVAIDKEVHSKKGVIERLAGMLCAGIDDLTPMAAFDALIAREKLGSTGLGGGVAIPHGRVAQAEKACAALLVAGSPVSFDAVDNQPVDLFVGLLVPEEANETHLKLLASLAELLSDGELTRKLRSATSPERVFELLLEAKSPGAASP